MPCWVKSFCIVLEGRRFHVLRSGTCYSREPGPANCQKVLYTVLAGFALHGIVAGGIGKHANEIRPEEATIAFRAWFVWESLYGPLSAAVRTSIALFLFKLRPSDAAKKALYGCLGTIYAFTVAYILINVLQCSPPSYFWRQFEDIDAVGSCPNPHMVPKAAIAHSVLAALSDWLIALLTFLLLRRSMMGKWKKTVTVVFLSLGTVYVWWPRPVELEH